MSYLWVYAHLDLFVFVFWDMFLRQEKTCTQKTEYCIKQA